MLERLEKSATVFRISSCICLRKIEACSSIHCQMEAFLARSYQFLNPSAGNSGPAARFCVKNSRNPVLEEKALIEVFSQFRTVQPSFD